MAAVENNCDKFVSESVSVTEFDFAFFAKGRAAVRCGQTAAHSI